MRKEQDKPVLLEWCSSCRRKHYMTLKKCLACDLYEVLQPVSEAVFDKCCANYICDACEAYWDPPWTEEEREKAKDPRFRARALCRLLIGVAWPKEGK